MTKEQYEKLMVTLNEKEEKYFDLVWYARSNPNNIDVKGVRENIQRITEKYPEEMEKLYEDGDWQHGFNSGCLAAFRYITLLIEEGKELAEEEFPDLDS